MEEATNLKDFIVKCLEDKQAEAITVIDVAKKTTLTEYIILANGRSTKNVAAIAGHVSLELKHVLNISSNIEGLEKSEWVLVDAGAVLVNIFYPETREYFKLETKWNK